MRLLLDTHFLLWLQFEPQKIKPEFRVLIESSDNEVFFSAASIWEIAIKAALRRTDFSASPLEVLDAARQAGFEELSIRSETTLLLANLPKHHSDPFDRLLIAQAIEVDARLLTRDRAILRYDGIVTFA